MAEENYLVRGAVCINPVELFERAQVLLFSEDKTKKDFYEDIVASAFRLTDMYASRIFVKNKNVLLEVEWLFGSPESLMVNTNSRNFSLFSNLEVPNKQESYRVRIPVKAVLPVGTLGFDRFRGKSVDDFAYTFRQI